MSKLTARAALRFVSAYTAADKSSAAMVQACADILADGTPATALVAAVRGAYESKGHSFDSAGDRKRFEILVSQRSFAAQLARTVTGESIIDPVIIAATLSVASGQLPRKTALAIAEAHRDSEDGPAFRDAIKDAKVAAKATPKAPEGVKSGQEPKDGPAPVVVRDIAPEDISWKVALQAIDNALASESDPKAHAAMVKALKATLLRHSMVATPAVKATVKA